MDRRNFLGLPLALSSATALSSPQFAQVESRTLAFPRDHGAHPGFRTEWWYLTGWVSDAQGRELGVQVTFFRSRPAVNEDSRSRFAPLQLLFAHAAIADRRHGRLRHDQRAARTGWGLATVSEATTDVALGDWSLRLEEDAYEATIIASDFALALAFHTRAPPLLQGVRGVSRKGPRPEHASHYYSRPQLAVAGSVTLDGASLAVRGLAWLDHEWSTSYLAPGARGWDWIGINFDDGSALMAFRIRGADGSDVWRGGATRDAAGIDRALASEAIRFTALRQWRSPRTDIAYPVSLRVEAGGDELVLEPLMDDQELDARTSVGTIYWEGAVAARRDGRVVGRGYLELTGYGSALRI